MEEKVAVQPLVKWAGGKRQLLTYLMKYAPANFNRYYEPFFGGGALLFGMMPQVPVTINDINEELIAIYRCLADPKLYQELILALKAHEANHSREYFMQVRKLDRDEQTFSKLSLATRAARTIYLNKSCFNGLYRVNSQGHFNVPFGSKINRVKTYNEANIEALHDYFMNNPIRILCGDYRQAVADAQADDFIYFDPPYDVIPDKDSFTAYAADDFNADDQRELARIYRELDARGVKLMLSNHNTPLIQELYAGYEITIVYAKRMINARATGRGAVEEVIITNYPRKE